MNNDKVLKLELHTQNWNMVEWCCNLLDNNKWRAVLYLRHKDPIELKSIPGDFDTVEECSANAEKRVKINILDY